jgi:RNA polymerase sigma-70 factor (ECF subfamily)
VLGLLLEVSRARAAGAPRGPAGAAREPAERFRPPGDPGAGRWVSPPRRWPDGAGERSAAARRVVARAVAELPADERALLLLRDLAGLSGAEAGAVLGLDAAGWRAGLRRARARVRQALAAWLEAPPAG